MTDNSLRIATELIHHPYQPPQGFDAPQPAVHKASTVFFENVAAMRAVLDGATGAYRDAVLLNSAAALLIAAKVNDLKEGVALAAQSIDSGAARAKVAALAAAVPLPPAA